MAEGISLHIGLNSVNANHYAGWSGELMACEADAEDIQAIADDRGFSSTILKTKSATRQAVVNAIKNAGAKLKSGDIFLVSYSGHGGQLPDKDGDEVDSIDETWCLYDGQLVDDEIYKLWAAFPEGARILVLSDSCHSGTVVKAMLNPQVDPRDTSAVYRYMPGPIALRTYRHNKSFYEAILGDLVSPAPRIKATVRLISGCQDNQYSLDGVFNGLFTGTLLRVWNDGKFKGDYSSFHSAIVNRMPSTQTPNHFLVGARNPAYDEQTPFTI